MKFTGKTVIMKSMTKKNTLALVVALGVSTTLVACSSDTTTQSTTVAATATTTASVAQASALPTADDLNAILEKASDPSVPTEEKVSTVQGGETAPELFETMAASKQESGAEFHVVDPILPGYTNDSVLATVSFTLPDRPAQTADNVEFIKEDGVWKLSQAWACTLITNTVSPEQVPAMCASTTTTATAN